MKKLDPDFQRKCRLCINSIPGRFGTDEFIDELRIRATTISEKEARDILKFFIEQRYIYDAGDGKYGHMKPQTE